MELVLTADERAALVTAAAAEGRVRRWRRFQALLLVADGDSPEAAATSVGCSRAGVYNWVAAWRRAGLAGITEAAHASPPPAHTAPLAALLTERLGGDPQQYGHHATGWTVPLLHGEAQDAGIAVSETTVRRAVRRLGWRWKRPKYVLGRPDPQYAEKKGRSRRR
jgi:transposase